MKKDMPDNTALTSVTSPDALSLLSLWRILWGRKWVIACVVFAFAAIGFVLTSGGTSTYTTETLLVLEDTNAALATTLSRDELSYDDPSRAVEVFGSKRVIARVVDELDLINDPEFNPFLAVETEDQGPSLLQKMLSPLRDRFPALQSSEEPQAAPPALIRQTTISIVQERVRFIPDPRSTIIRVAATAESAERAAELANTAADAFLQDLLETRLDAVDRVVEQLGGRVHELRQDVRNGEAALQEFLNQQDGLDRDELPALGNEAQRTRARLAELEQDLDRRQALLTELDRIAALPEAEQQAQIDEIPALSLLVNSLPGADIPRIQTEISRRMDRDERLAAGLQTSLNELNDQLAEASDQLLRYQQLEREVAANSEIYEFSVRRLNELLVQIDVESGGGRIVFEAEVPQTPDGRGRIRTSILLGVLGFITAVAGILIREAANQSIRTSGDMQRLLPGQRVVSVPRAPRRRFFDHKAFKRRLLISPEVTDFSEAVRQLRSTLVLGDKGSNQTVVLTTSDFVTAGKAVLTLGLARSYALLGKNVLVVGADMRDMTLAKQLRQPVPKIGLQDVLKDPERLPDAIYLDPELGINLLLPSSAAGNPADLLQSPEFKKLMETVRTQHDVVLVDAPPLLAAPDAALVAQHADRLVFVAGGNASTAESVASALEQLPHPVGSSDVVALYGVEKSRQTRSVGQNRRFSRL